MARLEELATGTRVTGLAVSRSTCFAWMRRSHTRLRGEAWPRPSLHSRNAGASSGAVQQLLAEGDVSDER
jgi:hypothetical protein